jgi:hypothetical protein
LLYILKKSILIFKVHRAYNLTSLVYYGSAKKSEYKEMSIIVKVES